MQCRQGCRGWGSAGCVTLLRSPSRPSALQHSARMLSATDGKKPLQSTQQDAFSHSSVQQAPCVNVW